MRSEPNPEPSTAHERLLDAITVAGNTFDGHVTCGSAAALADLFEKFLNDKES